MLAFLSFEIKKTFPRARNCGFTSL
jgi:hypothetical protein